MGSGSLFFAVTPAKGLLSDSNPELISMFQELQRDPKPIIRVLRSLEWDEETYYKIRDDLFQRSRGPRRAAYFILLNRLCWNGLYRVSLKGHFNVPFGKQIYGDAFKESFLYRLAAAHETLSRVRVRNLDFEQALAHPRAGDFVFIDPPYVTGQGGRAFREYTTLAFSEFDEIRLAKQAIRLARAGVNVLVSHASTEATRRLYGGYFHMTELGRSETIAGQSDKRKRITEVLLSTFRFPNLETNLRSSLKAITHSHVTKGVDETRDPSELLALNTST